MKKLIIAAAVILTASFTACTKDNSVKPTSVSTKKLADDGNKQDLGQGDAANKQDLGQGDAAN
jgi:Spy/CpxP family protein refolding chaperone